MRLDRKLLLIAPTIVMICVIAGMIYAAMQLQVLRSVSDSLQQRNDFIAAVDRGEKPLSARQAIGILHISMDVEAKRTAAITAARDLLAWLAGIATVACVVLLFGIKSVPREHWPRMTFNKRVDA